MTTDTEETNYRRGAIAPESRTPRPTDAEILDLLLTLQGLTNPVSGFMKRGSSKRRKYADKIRDRLREMIVALDAQI